MIKCAKTASFHLRNIGLVRKQLTKDATRQLVQSLVISRLDYCNSLLNGAPDKLFKRLRRVHHKAARLITLTRLTDSIGPIMKDVHWLSVEYRAKFKALTLVYKSLHDTGPKYLRDMLVSDNKSRSLRSHVKDLLFVPKKLLPTVGDRAFAVQGPTLWNTHPLGIHNSPSLDAFKCNLKTHYFEKAYSC